MPLIFTPRRPHPLLRTPNVMAIILPLAIVLCAAMPSRAETPTPPKKASGAAPLTSPPVSPAKAASAAKSAAQSVAPSAAQPVAPPLRTVTTVTAKSELWPEQIEAQGNIMPWQETRIGTEIGGLRLVSVQANVGDIVKKGQVLARLNPAPVEAELDAANAQLMEAQATLAQAVATLERAKRLAPSGGVSQQEMTLYETQKQTAAARLNAARAQVRTQQLRVDSATLVAPDDGVISSRSVAEGAIVQAGSELFRLIRQGRLEWRAEVKGELLLKISVGQTVTVKSPMELEVKGRVRQISPTIDLTTRHGLVYVDLPRDTNLKSGLFVSGTINLVKRQVLSLPTAAVLHEGDLCRVFTVNDSSRIEAVEVRVGRTHEGRVEILAGLDGHARVIARDLEQLKSGESVKLLDAPEAQKVTPAAS
jgi:HlyD family secretion protein